MLIAEIDIVILTFARKYKGPKEAKTTLKKNEKENVIESVLFWLQSFITKLLQWRVCDTGLETCTINGAMCKRMKLDFMSQPIQARAQNESNVWGLTLCSPYKEAGVNIHEPDSSTGFSGRTSYTQTTDVGERNRKQLHQTLVLQRILPKKMKRQHRRWKKRFQIICLIKAHCSGCTKNSSLSNKRQSSFSNKQRTGIDDSPNRMYQQLLAHKKKFNVMSP